LLLLFETILSVDPRQPNEIRYSNKKDHHPTNAMFGGYNPSARGPGGVNPASAPRGYVAGRGRGAAGFQTRSDLGIVDSEPSGSGSATTTTGGSNSTANNTPWGAAPRGYVPGAGRGAGKMGAGDNAAGEGALGRGRENNNAAGAGGAGQNNNERHRQQNHPQHGGSVEGQYDDDDHEADLIWAAIDERLQNRRRKKAKTSSGGGSGGDPGPKHSDDPRERERAKIKSSFRDAKEELSKVSEEAWMNLPDAMGDHSLKHKRAQERKRGLETFTPLSDSLLESRTASGRGLSEKSRLSKNATTTNMAGIGAARGTVLGMSLDRMSESANDSGLATSVNASGYLTSMSTINAAGGGPMGGNNLGDIQKARLLLKSVRDTNPHHGQGWIASARVEEAAGKTLRARKIIQEGCEACPRFVDVWLEAARLHPLPVAKSILATAVRRVDDTVPVFLKAAELETQLGSKKAVLRKALEANPHSLRLWKHAIGLEDTDEAARILLGVAVEKVPEAVELWLALARLESYEDAQATLNRARKALPLEKSVWMAASKLEESRDHLDRVPKIVAKAFRSLARNEVVITRTQWIAEAEACEEAGAPRTSAAIVELAIRQGVLDEDRVRTWSDDARQVLARGSVATARAVLAHALRQFPTKRSLWMQAVELEQKHGGGANSASSSSTSASDNDGDGETATTTTTTTTTKENETQQQQRQHPLNEALDQVLQAASERLPRVEVFWLLRAKEQWLAGFVDASRDILAKAFEANPDSEKVWLAAAKLEWENGETERARVLLERARERAPSERVFMKSALLEREVGDTTAALALLEEGIGRYPATAPKLYMMGGQICSDDLSAKLLPSKLPPRGGKEEETVSSERKRKKLRSYLDKARRIYQEGIEKCRTGTDNVTLWILASRLEERAHTFAAFLPGDDDDDGSAKQRAKQQGVTKARSLLELARLQHPKNDELWLEATRLERRSGNPGMADSLMARALQERPKSGLLLAEHISTAPRAVRKSRSAAAIKRNPESPLVIAAVAELFAADRKEAKARKWFERAVLLDPDLGDSWARYARFERDRGTPSSRAAVRERCAEAAPRHGEVWQAATKAMEHRRKPVREGLDLAVAALDAAAASRPPSSG